MNRITEHKITNVEGKSFSAMYNAKTITEFEIDNTIEFIGDRAFCYCSKLSSITLPESVTSIGYGCIF